MGDFFKVLQDAGVAGYVIVALGIFACVIIFERVRVLFKESALDGEAFVEKIKAYIHQDKMEEAVTLASSEKNSPLAYIVKCILQKSDRDMAAMEEAHENGMSEMIPRLTKNLGFLAMISNVSTLVGLLGTIQGLIASFNAVSFADPTQKQALLAQGISQAMYTTAMGLSVAIPVMIVYAFLQSRQGKIFEDLNRYSGRVLDVLKERDFTPFSQDGAFPGDLSESPEPLKKAPKTPVNKKKSA